MKTKKQVEHFLRKRKYRSEMDFKGISSYCRGEFNIKLHVPSSYSDDPESLDYATFADWFDNGFGAGDAVKWGGTVGANSRRECTYRYNMPQNGRKHAYF